MPALIPSLVFLSRKETPAKALCTAILVTPLLVRGHACPLNVGTGGTHLVQSRVEIRHLWAPRQHCLVIGNVEEFAIAEDILSKTLNISLFNKKIDQTH